jgi:hypothetical protein
MHCNGNILSKLLTDELRISNLSRVSHYVRHCNGMNLPKLLTAEATLLLRKTYSDLLGCIWWELLHATQ